MTEITISLIIAVIVLILYATQILPLSVTAILSSLAMAFFGIISFEDAIVSFGSDALILVVGAIIMGTALVESGVTKIIATSILKVKVLSENERLFLLVTLTLCAALSAFLSNSACVAIFLPIVAAVAKESNGKITKKNTFMAIGVASVAGGMCTLVGSTPQIIASGILEQTEGCEPLSFFEITKGGLLVTAIVIMYFCTFGYNLQKRVYSFKEKSLTAVVEEMDEFNEIEDKEINKPKAIIATTIFVGCIICFITGIGSVGTVALLGGALCIATKCLSEKKALASVDWRAVAVMGGALGFSKGLNESGAIQMIAEKTVNLFGGADADPLILCIVLFTLGVILTNLMSNAACAAILTPLGIAIALAIGADPTTFVIIIVLGADISYVTPIASPPLTMTLVGGYRFTDYVKIGTPLAIIIILLVPILTCIIYGF